MIRWRVPLLTRALGTRSLPATARLPVQSALGAVRFVKRPARPAVAPRTPPLDPFGARSTGAPEQPPVHAASEQTVTSSAPDEDAEVTGFAPAGDFQLPPRLEAPKLPSLAILQRQRIADDFGTTAEHIATMHGRGASAEEIRRVIRLATARGVNAENYPERLLTDALHKLVRRGKLDLAERLLERAGELEVRRTDALYAPIVREAAYLGDAALVDRMLARLRQDGFDPPPESSKLQASLAVSLLILARLPDAARATRGGTLQACWDLCHAIENALFWPGAARAARAAYGLPPDAPHEALGERMAEQAAAAGLLDGADPTTPIDWLSRALLRAQQPAEVAALHAAAVRVFLALLAVRARAPPGRALPPLPEAWGSRLRPEEALPWARSEAAAHCMAALVKMGRLEAVEAYMHFEGEAEAPAPCLARLRAELLTARLAAGDVEGALALWRGLLDAVLASPDRWGDHGGGAQSPRRNGQPLASAAVAAVRPLIQAGRGADVVEGALRLARSGRAVAGWGPVVVRAASCLADLGHLELARTLAAQVRGPLTGRRPQYFALKYLGAVEEIIWKRELVEAAKLPEPEATERLEAALRDFRAASVARQRMTLQRPAGPFWPAGPAMGPSYNAPLYAAFAFRLMARERHAEALDLMALAEEGGLPRELLSSLRIEAYCALRQLSSAWRELKFAEDAMRQKGATRRLVFSYDALVRYFRRQGSVGGVIAIVRRAREAGVELGPGTLEQLVKMSEEEGRPDIAETWRHRIARVARAQRAKGEYVERRKARRGRLVGGEPVEPRPAGGGEDDGGGVAGRV